MTFIHYQNLGRVSKEGKLSTLYSSKSFWNNCLWVVFSWYIQKSRRKLLSSFTTDFIISVFKWITTSVLLSYLSHDHFLLFHNNLSLSWHYDLFVITNITHLFNFLTYTMTIAVVNLFITTAKIKCLGWKCLLQMPHRNCDFKVLEFISSLSEPYIVVQIRTHPWLPPLVVNLPICPPISESSDTKSTNTHPYKREVKAHKKFWIYNSRWLIGPPSAGSKVAARKLRARRRKLSGENRMSLTLCPKIPSQFDMGLKTDCTH